MLFKECQYFCPNNFKFCAITKNYKTLEFPEQPMKIVLITKDMKPLKKSNKLLNKLLLKKTKKNYKKLYENDHCKKYCLLVKPSKHKLASEASLRKKVCRWKKQHQLLIPLNYQKDTS